MKDINSNILKGKSVTMVIRFCGILQALENAADRVVDILGETAVRTPQHLADLLAELAKRRNAELCSDLDSQSLRSFAIGTPFESSLPAGSIRAISESAAQNAVNIIEYLSTVRNAFRGVAENPTSGKTAHLEHIPSSLCDRGQGEVTATMSPRQVQVARGLLLVPYILSSLSDILKVASNKKLSFIQRGDGCELPATHSANAGSRYNEGGCEFHVWPFEILHRKGHSLLCCCRCMCIRSRSLFCSVYHGEL